MKNVTRRLVTFLFSLSLLAAPFQRLSAAVATIGARRTDKAVKEIKRAPFVLKNFIGDLKDKILIAHTSHRSHASHSSHSSHRSSSGTYDQGTTTEGDEAVPQAQSAVPKPSLQQAALEKGQVTVIITVPANCKVIYTTDGTMPTLKNGTVIVSDTVVVLTKKSLVIAMTVDKANKTSPIATLVVEP